MTNGTEYEVQVRATNGQGDSSYSTSSTITAGSQTVPVTPAAPVILEVNDNNIWARWLAPNDGGTAITGYDLRYRDTGTSVWTDVSDLTDTEYTIDDAGLTGGTQYEVQVRATNSEGDSSYSASSTLTLRVLLQLSDFNTTDRDIDFAGVIDVGAEDAISTRGTLMMRTTTILERWWQAI